MSNLLKLRIAKSLILWLIVFIAFHPLVYAQPPHQEGMEESQEEMQGFVDKTLARFKEFVENAGVNMGEIIERIKEFFAGFGGNFQDLWEWFKGYLQDVRDSFPRLFEYIKELLDRFFAWQKSLIESLFNSIKFE